MELFDASAYRIPTKGLKKTTKTKGKIAEYLRDFQRQHSWPTNYSIANTPNDLGRIARLIDESGSFVFDVETDGLNPWQNKVLCMSLYAGDQGFVVPFEHATQATIEVDSFRRVLGNFFTDPGIQRTNHNIKFDMHFIEESLGIPCGEAYCDTLLLAWMLDPNVDHGLKEQSSFYGLADDTGNYKKQFGATAWSYLDPYVANYYACKDVELVARLYQEQIKKLNADPRMSRTFWNDEMKTLNIAYDAERQGIMVDLDYVEKTLKPTVYKEFEEAVEALRPYVEPHLSKLNWPKNKSLDQRDVYGALASDARLREIFFDILGIPLIKGVTLKEVHEKQEDGSYVTTVKRTLDKNAILQLSEKYESIKRLGRYRQVTKVKSAFVDNIHDWVTNGICHPTINVIGARTFRMSMSDPNLQQIPSRMGPLVRNAFVPRPGHVFASMDASQQELRLTAHFSGDDNLVRIFRNDEDIYTQTAIAVFHDDSSEYDTTFKAKNHPHRRDAKILILGLGFGMGPGKYARTIGATEAQGKRDHGNYHRAYPGVNRLKARVIKYARKHGHIVTLLGHKRPLPNILSDDPVLRSKDERAAMNTPIQCGGAEMIKRAGINADALIKKNKWPTRIALYVHDEILFEMAIDWAKNNPQAIDALKNCIETAIPLIVPMKSSVTFETRWGSERDIDDIDFELLEEDVA